MATATPCTSAPTVALNAVSHGDQARGFFEQRYSGSASSDRTRTSREPFAASWTRPGWAPRQAGSRARQRTTKALGDPFERRRKLLEVHYADQVSADLFAVEEQHLAQQLAALRAELVEIEESVAVKEELGRRFASVLATFEQLDFERVWEAATDQERRVLIEELLEAVTVYPGHLEVAVHGVRPINVLLSEVGLADQSGFAGVGGGT